MALDPADAERMIAASAEAGVVLSVISQRRWYEPRPARQGGDRRAADRRAGASPRSRCSDGVAPSTSRWMRGAAPRPARAVASSSTRPSTSSTWSAGCSVRRSRSMAGPPTSITPRSRSRTARSRSCGSQAAPWPRSSPATRRSPGCTPGSTSMARAAPRLASRPTADPSSWPGSPCRPCPERPVDDPRRGGPARTPGSRPIVRPCADVDIASHYHELQLRDIVGAIVDGRPPAVTGRRRPARRGPDGGDLPRGPGRADG